MENKALQSLQIFYIIVLRGEITTPFDSKMVLYQKQFPHVILYNNIENLRTSQGYIFRILEHIATKFWNFTSFERFFPGVSFFVWICLGQKLVQ